MTGCVVVTGAAGGLGQGLVAAAASRGHPVVLVGLDSAALNEAAALVGGDARVTDVTEVGAMQALATSVYARYGSVRLLINNAGLEVVGPLWSQPERSQRLLQVNLLGVLAGVIAFVPPMLTQPGPAGVVNIGSIGSFTAGALQGAYQVSKRGVLALSECLAADLAAAGSAITVTTAFPGPVRTGIFASAADPDADAAAESARASLASMLTQHGMSAERAGELIIDAALAGRRWMTTDPALAQALAKDLLDRTAALAAALGD